MKRKDFVNLLSGYSVTASNIKIEVKKVEIKKIEIKIGKVEIKIGIEIEGISEQMSRRKFLGYLRKFLELK